jgi:hypothetical protein
MWITAIYPIRAKAEASGVGRFADRKHILEKIMKTSPIAFALAITAIVANSAPATAETIRIKLDDNVSVFAFGERKMEPDFVIVAGAREHEGKVAVCGQVFFTPSGDLVRPYERKITRKVKFSIGGTKLLVQTDVFRRFATEAAATDGTAGCAVTRTPWSSSYAALPLEMESGDVRVTDS